MQRLIYYSKLSVSSHPRVFLISLLSNSKLDGNSCTDGHSIWGSDSTGDRKLFGDYSYIDCDTVYGNEYFGDSKAYDGDNFCTFDDTAYDDDNIDDVFCNGGIFYVLLFQYQLPNLPDLRNIL